MLRIISETTINLLKDNLSKMNISSKITEKDLDSIFNFFEMEEISLSNDNDENMSINYDYVKAVSNATSEFLRTNELDKIDLADLNSRLGFDK